MVSRDKLSALPDSPGVYLMKNEAGDIIYVGKAVSLRRRVSSYFQGSRRRDPKTAALVSRITDFDIVMTDSEIEALMLECNLIKKHRPPYNILMMDDKHYPYLRLTMEEPYPRLVIARGASRDGSQYFGPYADSGAVRETMRLVKRIFGIRSCRGPLDGKAPRACINNQIKLCSGPCSGRVDRGQYLDICRRTALFLGGRSQALLAELNQRMKAEAEALNFESAARLRDQIKAVNSVMERQKIIDPGLKEKDVIAMSASGDRVVIQLFNVREGKLTGQRAFDMSGAVGAGPEVMAAFMKQHYATADTVATQVLVNEMPEEAELIREWLGERRGRRVEIRRPRRGDGLRLVEMAERNASFRLHGLPEGTGGREGKVRQSLAELLRLLDMPGEVPERLEAYDISNLSGRDAVGAMAVMTGGRISRGESRCFRIKGDFSGEQDDCGMMAEVLQRRLAGDDAPGLMIVDGGKGQLGVAVEALRRAGREDTVRVMALAKEREEIYLPGRETPIVLPPDSPALLLVRRLRDEVHRMAVGYHRRLRSRRLNRSVLDDVRGIGPARKKALLTRIGSVAAMAAMSPGELAARGEIPLGLARSIIEKLNDVENAAEGGKAS